MTDFFFFFYDLSLHPKMFGALLIFCFGKLEYLLEYLISICIYMLGMQNLEENEGEKYL